MGGHTEPSQINIILVLFLELYPREKEPIWI